MASEADARAFRETVTEAGLPTLSYDRFCKYEGALVALLKTVPPADRVLLADILAFNVVQLAQNGNAARFRRMMGDLAEGDRTR